MPCLQDIQSKRVEANKHLASHPMIVLVASSPLQSDPPAGHPLFLTLPRPLHIPTSLPSITLQNPSSLRYKRATPALNLLFLLIFTPSLFLHFHTFTSSSPRYVSSMPPWILFLLTHKASLVLLVMHAPIHPLSLFIPSLYLSVLFTLPLIPFSCHAKILLAPPSYHYSPILLIFHLHRQSTWLVSSPSLPSPSWVSN